MIFDQRPVLGEGATLVDFGEASKAFSNGTVVKNLPAMRESWVLSLGWEDPLEEGIAAHSSLLAWRIPTDRGGWQATVHGVTKSRTRLSD